MRYVLTAFLVIFLMASAAYAIRGPAPKVEPIFHNGIKYTAPNDEGHRAYVVAWNASTNEKLWDVTIFNNRIDSSIEEDVQWVFIEKMTLKNERLSILAENGNRYSLDLKTKVVTGPIRRIF